MDIITPLYVLRQGLDKGSVHIDLVGHFLVTPPGRQNGF